MGEGVTAPAWKDAPDAAGWWQLVHAMTKPKEGGHWYLWMPDGCGTLRPNRGLKSWHEPARWFGPVVVPPDELQVGLELPREVEITTLDEGIR